MGAYVFGVAMISNGRRSAIMKASILGIVACIIMMIKTYSTLIFGRLLYGLASGILSVACIRYLEEYTP